MELSSFTHLLRNEQEENRGTQSIVYPLEQQGWDQSFPFSIPAKKVLEFQRQPQGHLSDANKLNDAPWREEKGTFPRSKTLFIGQLPVLCDEMKLLNLFHRFGEIEAIQFKKNSSDLQQSHLSYGFIRFASHESAVRALEEVNGFSFYGRNLRLGWAEDRDRGSHHFQRNQPVEVLQKKKNFPPTAQIHVSYTSRDMNQQISELDLRRVFQQFGNVVDVEVKKSSFNQGSAVQSGYGFVRFALTEEGVQSALTAIDFVTCKVIDGTSFQCTATHGLKTHMLSMMRERRLQQQSVRLMDKLDGYSGTVGVHHLDSFSGERGQQSAQMMNASHSRTLLRHDISTPTIPVSAETSKFGLHDSEFSRMSKYSPPNVRYDSEFSRMSKYSPPNVRSAPPISSIHHNFVPLLKEGGHFQSHYSQFDLF